MRKFLSILMLACLLWGLALPAAAEGEPTLYAKLEDKGEYLTELTVPVGLSRQFSFYTSADGTSYDAVTAAPTSSNTTVAAITGEGNLFTIQGLKADTATLTLYEGDNPSTTAITVMVPESTLQIRRADGEWGTSLSGITVNESVSVELRLGADTVFDDCTDSVTASEGLTYSSGTLSAEAAGTYTLSVGEYKVTIVVDPEPLNEIPISKDDLTVLSNQALFDQFLIDNHYSGSGDLTLLLPTGDLGSVTCNVTLNNGAGLILKGTSGTKMKGLTVAAENVSVDSITFTGSPAVSVSGVSGCAVSNCDFQGSFAFRLWQNAGSSAPKLTLENNTVKGFNVELRDASGKNLIGTWQSTNYDKSKPETVDFGVTVTKKTNDIRVQVAGDMRALAEDGWKFKWVFYTADGFETGKAFAVYDGEKINASLYKSGSNNVASFAVPIGGEYTIVKGTYPTITKKDDTTKTVSVSSRLNTYLKKVTVPCKDFTAVKVTDSKGKTVAWELDSAGNLTITLTGNSPYTIKKVSTTQTVTKTTTTPRTYKYTYQDYYLVTPAGFSNAVRGVKDNLVTLNCTEAGRRPVSLPVASMASAAEKGYDVLVKTKYAELTLDAAALKSMAQQAKGTTVLLHYKSLNHKTLTSVGQASLQSHLTRNPGHSADLAFLVTATSDSETIEDLQQGTITLKIPFIVLPGTEGLGNEVYALQSETVTDPRETVVADGYLTTQLHDLTEHMVFQVGQPPETTEATEETTEETTVETTEPTTVPETEPETEATRPPKPEKVEKKGGLLGVLITILGILLAVVCGVLGFVFLRRRKKQELD